MGRPSGPGAFSLVGQRRQILSHLCEFPSTKLWISEIAFPSHFSNHASLRGFFELSALNVEIDSLSICSSSSNVDPLMFKEELKFLDFFPLAVLWKELVFLSPCLSQLNSRFLFPADFFLIYDIYSCFVLFRSLNSSSDSPKSDSFWSRWSICWERVSFCWAMLPNTSMFQIFRFCLTHWSFCYILSAAQPCIWVWFHQERIDALNVYVGTTCFLI